MALRSLRNDETGPEVWLIDASSEGLDETALRARARRLTAGAPHCSRSYRYPYALIARHSLRVGVDIERVERCDPAFLDAICTPAELRDPPVGDEQAISLWSGKEALAKALGDAVAYDPRRLEAPRRWADGTAGPWRAQSLPAPAGHVAWVCLEAAEIGCAGAPRAPARMSQTG